MKVTLLGTAGADGWPNPFCRCASCTALRSRGEVRGQPAALLDDAVLLECGPETLRAAARAGRVLDGVRLVLVTHAHPDHLDPAFLLWHAWAGAPALTVAGPPGVVAACRDWLAPQSGVSLHPLRPGETLVCEGYRVRAVPAAHCPPGGADPLAAEALLYDVTGPDGARVLWATDTGPLPAATVDSLRDTAYDLVALEESFGDHTDHGTGHLDLVTFPRVLADLRRVGAVVDHTAVVAVHLGHHNPDVPVLRDRLGAWGVSVVDDLTTLQLGSGRQPGTAAAEAPQPGTAAAEVPQPPPARRTLLLGGARSGKSVTAERLLADRDDVIYVATAAAGTAGPADAPADPEWSARIAAHQARRPAAWTTIETLDIAEVVAAAGPGQAVLVDCLSLWLAGLLDRHGAWDGGGAAVPAALDAAVAGLLDALRRSRARIVLVSNETGMGVVPATASGRLCRDHLGILNTRVAAACDDVTLLVAGRAVPLSGSAAPAAAPTTSAGGRTPLSGSAGGSAR
ncbi:MAG: bifunctional adenosylcobinamide kinase/adenosylcobinamide-phosphate guanylyltransferase [Actinomycetota bacterium]|nr:MAG: bifunctional adenosylcobinamide kinase/adenosylcobinamide-phosphate guanylyltransferase [Actinomycetota bacterium]